MKLFGPMYDKTISLSKHPKATWYLSALSFSESVFFPVPTDVMLAPMCLANRHKAMWLAFITTIFSVLGGLFGYFLGFLAFEMVEPLIKDFGYWESFEKAQAWFAEWGIWVILIAGFSPIPYKVFTITAGVVGMAVIPFLIMSLFARGARFFLVAGLVAWGGPKFEPLLRRYIEIIGWIVVLLVVILYFVIRNH